MFKIQREKILTVVRSRSLKNFYVLVLQRTPKKCTNIFNARTEPLFCSLNLFLFRRSRSRCRRVCVRSVATSTHSTSFGCPQFTREKPGNEAATGFYASLSHVLLSLELGLPVFYVTWGKYYTKLPGGDTSVPSDESITIRAGDGWNFCNQLYSTQEHQWRTFRSTQDYHCCTFLSLTNSPCGAPAFGGNKAR